MWVLLKVLWQLINSFSEWFMRRNSWGSAVSHFCFDGGLCYDLYHCGRILIILLTVISCKVFRLQAADGERIICPRPTATEPWWDPIFQDVCTIDQELRRVPWFLLIPCQPTVNVLTGLTCHGDSISQRHQQWSWRLSHLNVTSGTWGWKIKNKFPHN